MPAKMNCNRLLDSEPRCSWATTPQMIAYHDAEWGVPQHDDRVLFEFLILEGAQAGLSWSTILAKRNAYRRAFSNFNPKSIARYDASKTKQLMANEGIVRNRLKIAAAVQNARAFLAVQKRIRLVRWIYLAICKRIAHRQCAQRIIPDTGANRGI